MSINRRATGMFDPECTITNFETTNVSSTPENRRGLIEQYLHFEQLMLRIDSEEADDQSLFSNPNPASGSETTEQQQQQPQVILKSSIPQNAINYPSSSGGAKSSHTAFNQQSGHKLNDDNILWVHGGLSPEIQTTEEGQEIPRTSAFCDLAWSDPEDAIDTCATSSRGAGLLLGGLLVTDMQINEKECHFTKLSSKLILRIMSFLNILSLAKLSQTCKRMKKISSKSFLWEGMDLSFNNFQCGHLKDCLARNPKFLNLTGAKIHSPQYLLTIPLHLPTGKTELNLTYLDLSTANITPENLVPLLTICKRLTKLSLEGICLGPNIFLVLSRDLDTLNLCMAQNIVMDEFILWIRRTTRLKVLNISWVQQEWTPHEFSRLIKSMPRSLMQLSIAGYQKLMTDNHVTRLLGTCEFLLKLDLSDNYQLTEISVLSIVISLKWLRSLAINRNVKIGILSLQHLQKSKDLKELQIFGISKYEHHLALIRNWLKNAQINKNPFFNIGRSSSRSSQRLWCQQIQPVFPRENWWYF